MAQKPLTMEQLKQILQLHHDGIGIREMSRRLGISRNSMRKYLALLQPVCARGQQPDNTTLANTAYINNSIAHDAGRLQQLIDHFSYAQAELVKTGVTRQLLWQEYIGQHSDGYVYSHYCYHLTQYFKSRDLSMHLEYKAADMIMIDFAGKKQYYIVLATGERIDCQVFVAILPFSGLIFCKAVHSQQTADFADCINAMLRFYGGVPATILCDNLKTAVKRADRYEPAFTDICHQLSEHYSTTFTATHSYSPRDKAMVERAVNILYNHVYGPLRKLEFTSLQALNHAMQEQLIVLNNKPYKNTPYSRQHFFENQERSLLKALPGEPFSPKKVAILTVQRNYHVQLTEDHRYYSVPYQHVGKKVKVLYDDHIVEVYIDSQRIALHVRKNLHKAYTTLADHMPPHHQRMQQIKGFNRDDLLMQASLMGNAIKKAACLLLQNSIYIEQNYKACLGMLLLEKIYGAQRLEAACSRALQGSRINYSMIKNILKYGLDKQVTLAITMSLPDHDNIRGKDHYK